jgi:hypothetical protein
MSEYNEQVMKLVKVVRDKTFLFPKTMPNRLKFGPYFEWFESHNKTEFNQMPAMVHLNPDVMDQYSKKVVWTGFAPMGTPGSYGMHTLIQVRPDYHIIFLYAQEDSQVSVIATLYLLDPQEYLKFMEENEKYIIRGKQSLGFGGVGLGFDLEHQKQETKV